MRILWLGIIVFGNHKKRFLENRWDVPRFVDDDSFDSDWKRFDFIKEVADNSSNIELTEVVKEEGGRFGQGMSCYDYITKSGIEFTIVLYGGMPIPETTSYEFVCCEFSDTLIKELVDAIGEYYRTQFRYYEFFDNDSTASLYLYESKADKECIDSHLNRGN